jgi:hypothetical protein
MSIPKKLNEIKYLGFKKIGEPNNQNKNRLINALLLALDIRIVLIKITIKI